MARSVRDSNLETRKARLKLEIGKRHWKQIGKGLALGYRRTTEGYGSWCVRLLTPEGKYPIVVIGRADDYQDANGADILDFFQAQAKCREHFEQKAAEWRGEVDKPVTVADAAARYLAWFKDHRKSYFETESAVNVHILPHFGDKLLAELTTPEIRAWLDALASSPARRRTGMWEKQQKFADKPATTDAKRARKSSANRVLTVFKAILNKAFHDELVRDDTPWRRVKPFPNADEAITRFLTVAESTRLINACKADFRLLVKAALFTGARYGELIRLRAGEVNTDTGMVVIHPAAKSGKLRYVPLSAEGLEFFKEQITGKRGDALVFVREDGLSWGKSHQDRPLRTACQQAAIEPPVSFHELRHTYASLLAQAGADLLTISKLLGHADTRITSRHYAHLCDRTLADTVKAKLPSFGHVSDSKVQAIR